MEEFIKCDSMYAIPNDYSSSRNYHNFKCITLCVIMIMQHANLDIFFIFYTNILFL